MKHQWLSYCDRSRGHIRKANHSPGIRNYVYIHGIVRFKLESINHSAPGFAILRVFYIRFTRARFLLQAPIPRAGSDIYSERVPTVMCYPQSGSLGLRTTTRGWSVVGPEGTIDRLASWRRPALHGACAYGASRSPRKPAAMPQFFQLLPGPIAVFTGT